MKKTLAIFAIALAFAGCKGNKSGNTADSTTTTTTTTTSNTSEKTTNVVDTVGQSLIAKNDCLTCHQVSQKVVGPAYNDVAEKYKSADASIVDTLANKVIKGGSGNWGTVAMTPHPSLSMDDARHMVRYVLSLKK
jgi:cytochrome c